VISKADFEKVTGETLKTASLDYQCNNAIHYTVRGSHVALEILWNWESPTGDIYEASFRGTRSRVELRHGELFVVAHETEVFDALDHWAAAMRKTYPGLSIDRHANEARIVVPAKYNVGHEDHFAQVTNRFFEYLKAPSTLPDWERTNMLVKYLITTSK
jgi:hypothetical protein